MGCLVALVVIALVLFGSMWLAFGLVGLLLTLAVAGIIGAVADAVVPGRLPGGLLGAVLAGIIGGFLGALLFRLVGIQSLGPALFGVHLLPAFVGAVIIAALAQWFSGTSRGRRYMA